MNQERSVTSPPVVSIQQAAPSDIGGILALKRRIQGISLPWGEEELKSQIGLFPEGQFVARDSRTGLIIGALGSLVIARANYSLFSRWSDLTADGTFKNHDPGHGKTLIRSHLIVDPLFDNHLIRDRMSQVELKTATRLGLERIRAGVRFKDYYLFHYLGPGEYFRMVQRGRISDSWVTQALDSGFKALALVPGYYPRDWRSDGNAVVAQLDLPVFGRLAPKLNPHRLRLAPSPEAMASLNPAA